MAFLAAPNAAVVVPSVLLWPWPVPFSGGAGSTPQLYLTSDGRIVSTVTPPAGARLIAYSA